MISRDVPVLLLLFNRPDTTRLLIDALRLIGPTCIYIAQDGPRNPADETAIELVRKELKNIDWNCEIHELWRDTNLGCYDAVTSGIDWFFSAVEFGIILEDDCIPAQSFFDFCFQVNNALERDDISLISGSNFLSISEMDVPFLTQHSPLLWGWATWREKWQFFSSLQGNKGKLLDSIQPKIDSYPYLDKRAIRAYIQGDYWDADWYLICLLHGWKAIVPPKNLITNVGAIGIHSGRPGPYHFLERHAWNGGALTFGALKISSRYDYEMIRFMRRMFFYGTIETFLKRTGLFSIVKKTFYLIYKKLYV